MQSVILVFNQLAQTRAILFYLLWLLTVLGINATTMSETDDLLNLLMDGSEGGSNSKDCDTWRPEITKLLIETRLGMENSFVKGEKGRNTLWNIVLAKMKKVTPDLEISVNDARKKFNNLMLTYKRNKKRKNMSGACSINWGYFDRFDEVYGCRHSIRPPENMTIDTLQQSSDEPSKESSTQDNEFPTEGPDVDHPKKKRKITAHEALVSYWKEEDLKEQSRHAERIRVEKEKNEIDKNKLEVMSDIKDLLLKLVNQ